MQPPTALPAFTKGVQLWPFGHSALEVHIVIPVHAPDATHVVAVRCEAKLAHPASLRSRVAPCAQQTGCPLVQSATGSAHCQSTAGAVQAVAMGVHAEEPLPAASQQCCVPGAQ